MAWLWLIVAAGFEVAFALLLKASEGFTRPALGIASLAAYLVSYACLAVALRTLPVGTGYAAWTGLGAAGTALAGMWLFGESREPLRLVAIGLVVAGVAGLKLAEP